MSKNSSGIDALNWDGLVAKALRRRKAERMTQKEHAALAGVSIPTIVAFDRGEKTLTLAKAFDILRVVGLVEDPSEEGSQEAFVQESFARWETLIARLPQGSPGRFPHGFYRIDYALKADIEGEMRHIELQDLPKLLKKAEIRTTGWPLFMSPSGNPGLEPREAEGYIECWINPEISGVTHPVFDAPYDFWRATPSGRLFAIRGYQEDMQETFAPGLILDTTLPIWRLGEGLLHAARLAKLMKRRASSEITVHFRALYTGLSGRLLRSWAKPLQAGLDMTVPAARGDEATLETVVSATAIEADLAGCVYPLVASLYERFGVAKLSPDYVKREVESFLERPAGVGHPGKGGLST